MVARAVPVDNASPNPFSNAAVRAASMITDVAPGNPVKTIGVDPTVPRLPDDIRDANIETFGAAATTLIAVRDEKYDVARSGAVGDGVADDTAELNAAAVIVGAVGGEMLLRKAHLVSGTVTIPASVTVTGRRGNGSVASVVESSATSGPVFLLNGRAAGVKKVRIDSTSGRRAASTTDGHGIFITEGDIASPTGISRFEISDVEIRDQPTDGLHTIGPIELSTFEQVTIYDCVRHGFVHDGGTVAGYTNQPAPPFVVGWKGCRAFECGGQAIIVRSTTGGIAAHRLTFDHFEALGCAWDSTKRYTGIGGGSELFQCIVGGNGVLWIAPDIEDQQYANTTTTVGGHARTGLANPASGVWDSATGTIVQLPYFSSLAKSWTKQAGVSGLLMHWPQVNNGAYATDQAPAIDIAASTCLDIEIHAMTAQMTGASTYITNRSTNARIVLDGIPYIGDAFTAFDIGDGLAPVQVTIATNILTTTARRTQVEGEAGAADDLATIRRASGINGTTGEDIFLFRGGEDITVKHGTGNIKTASAADVVMTATANTVLHFSYDGTNWVQV